MSSSERRPSHALKVYLPTKILVIAINRGGQNAKWHFVKNNKKSLRQNYSDKYLPYGGSLHQIFFLKPN